MWAFGKLEEKNWKFIVKCSRRLHNYRTSNCKMWVGREGLSWIADVKGLVHQPDSLDNLPLWPKTEHWKVKMHTDLSCEVIFIDSMFKWHVKALKATFFAIFICGQHRKLLWALYLRTSGDQRIGNCLSAIVTETLSLWNQKEVVWKKIYKKGGGGCKDKERRLVHW